MKNIFNKFAFFIALSFVFISCGNLTTSENDDSIPQGKGKITISTDLQNGRSVLPTAIKEDTEGLKWELVGTKDGTQQIIESWTDGTDETGTVTVTAYKSMTSNSGIVIDTGTWDFTLTASLVSDDASVAKVLVSEIVNATINAGENKLNFVMQEATGDTAASGSIEFTLNFPKDVVDNVEATLYKYDNANNVVDTNRQLTIDNSSNNNFDSVKYSYPDTTGTTSSPLSAGYYILKIELQQKKVDTTTPTVEHKTINTYSCLIRVAPGLKSKGVYTLDELAQLYTITYKLNEGTFDPTTSAVPTSYNAYTSFELPTPTREGYEFVGWYTDETYDTPASNDGTYKISTDTTLYAKWVEAVSGITHANNTLYISSYEGLKVFRDIVNGSLESNITIPGDVANSGASVTCYAGTPVTNYNAELQSNITINEDWTPIGVYTNASSQVPYVGEFKGNNNTITFDENFSINSQAAGLFGAISTNCNISNLIIEGNIQSSSTSTSYVGGIVGYATGGSVQNCVNRAKIQGTWAGGIAGKTQSTSFNGCVNFGEINGTNYSAGIVGSAASDTSINLCVNIGNLTSSATACGISGDVPTEITVQNCINLGTLSATNYIYGISSGSGTISSNISAGKFEGEIEYSCYAVSSSASNTNYYDNSICADNNLNTGSALGMATSDFSSWSPDNLVWSAEEGRYPLPNLLENSFSESIWSKLCVAAKISVSDPVGGDSITYGGTDSTGVPIFYVYSAEGLATFRNIVNGILLDDTLTSYTIPADSSVTGIADYSITTSDAFTNISGVLQADIDLSNIEWIPIGTEDSPFEGSFDGQNKTISNLTISNATTENQGLFGVFDCSLSDEKRCLSNICVTGSITTSSPYAGGLVGQATNIVFQNCENYIEINSSSETVGGFVGQADTCDFIGCTNYADIISTSSSSYNLCVGGIAGLITDVTAKYCYNAGNISANMSVGGIFGFEQNSSISYPTIDYCVNTGVITGSSYYGGIVGYASKALSLGYCANYGEITYSGNDDNPENGFILGGCSSSNKTLATEILSVGKSSSNGTAPTNPTYYAVSENASVTCSYYDSDKLTDIKGLSYNGGGNALSTSELINGTKLDDFYYGEWNYQIGRYPIPNLENNISADAWNLLVSKVSEQ